MSIRIEKVRLSPSGRAKLRKISRVVEKTARLSLKRHFPATHSAIVGFAPSRIDEKETLNRGDYGGLSVGNPPIPAGRFFKIGGQLWLQEAIRRERPMITTAGSITLLRFGNSLIINSLIGFSWKTSDGKIRSTSVGQELWGNLVQTWEGDSTATTSSRITARGFYPLRPDNKTSVPFVDKKIPPAHMFKRGYGSTRTALRNDIVRDIKNEVRKIRI